MIRRPPRSTRTDTLFPYTTLFRSGIYQNFDGPLGAWMKTIGVFEARANPVGALPKDDLSVRAARVIQQYGPQRSEEHTSELQSLMRISYAVFCLKKKKTKNTKQQRNLTTYDVKKHPRPYVNR